MILCDDRMDRKVIDLNITQEISLDGHEVTNGNSQGLIYHRTSNTLFDLDGLKGE